MQPSHTAFRFAGSYSFAVEETFSPKFPKGIIDTSLWFVPICYACEKALIFSFQHTTSDKFVIIFNLFPVKMNNIILLYFPAACSEFFGCACNAKSWSDFPDFRYVCTPIILCGLQTGLKVWNKQCPFHHIYRLFCMEVCL